MVRIQDSCLQLCSQVLTFCLQLVCDALLYDRPQVLNSIQVARYSEGADQDAHDVGIARLHSKCVSRY